MWIEAWWARQVIDRPGRRQLLQAGISEQQSCHCQSSVLVRCASHTYARGRGRTHKHTRKCKWGRTHTWADAKPFACPLYWGAHTPTHTLPLCPSCQKPVKWRVSCTASSLHTGRGAGYCLYGAICVHASLPAAAPSAHMGNCLIRLWEDPHVPAHLVIDCKICDLLIHGQVINHLW